MSKVSIDFYGGEDLIKKLEEAGANAEQEMIKALRASAQKPADEMLSFIRGHKKTGRTEESWKEEIKVKKGIITAELGFSVRMGGLPAIFWNVGTPRNAPPAHWFVDNAIEQNIDEIIKAQNEALKKAFEELI